MNAINRVYAIADQLLDIIQPEIDREPRQLGNLTAVFDGLATVLAPMITEPAAREMWDRALARQCRDHRSD